MAGSRKPGHLGLSDEVEDLNDGTMIRGLSPRPGPIGIDIAIVRSVPSSVSAGTTSIDRLLQQVRTVNSVEEVQRIAVAVLGAQCFSAGVIAGIGVDVFNSAKELIKLVGIFVLADLHDLRTSDISWWRYVNPLTAPELLSAKLAELLLHEELREAAVERDAIIKELSDVFQSPKAFFEGLADGVADDYKKDWQEYNAHMNARTLEGRFHAGIIFGQLLVDILGLLTGIAGLAKAGAKVAAKLPRLLKYARSVRIKPGVQRMPRSGGGTGAVAEALPKSIEQPKQSRSKSPIKPQSEEPQPKSQTKAPVKFGKKGKYTEPGAQPPTEKLRQEMKVAKAREGLPGPEKAGWPKIASDEAATFKMPPEPVELPEGTKLYRVIDSESNPNGSYWTTTDPGTISEAQWRSGAAVKGEWNGDGAFVEHEVPKGGLKVWSGEAAPQISSDGVNMLSGGGNQIWVSPGSTKASAPISTGWVK